MVYDVYYYKPIFFAERSVTWVAPSNHGQFRKSTNQPNQFNRTL